MLELSMKPTGWFQVAWSGEIPAGTAKPLRAFGRDLVGFRSHDGELAVLDAHCRHLGAHLGYESKVQGNCVVCPYHGWQWNLDGTNAAIPYQDQPSKARLGHWDVVEQHGIVFLWHDPGRGGPRAGWELPDLFTAFPELPGDPADYHDAWPHAIVDQPGEPVHPQLSQENTTDSMHFRYTHGAPEDPEMLFFEWEDIRWSSAIGFRSPRTHEIALRVFNRASGVGANFAVFDGRSAHYRLVLTATPVDEETSDLRVSYFLPRLPESRDELTDEQKRFAASTIELFEQDARIWRHQVFVQKPVFARQDVAAYTALRKWSEQFYEHGAGPTPTPVVVE
jgi:phenylpropionate dioxygenase-like ring-hydroxylating dioxygenase large terminal subunit